MKILYILKQDLSQAAKEILEGHKKGNEVTVIDLRQDKDYNKIIDLTVASDKVIAW